MNTYKLLVIASILFPCLMHAMHGTPQYNTPQKDVRGAKRAAKWATPTKKSKQRKIIRAQNAVAFNCTRKNHQASTHIIKEADFKLPAAARGNA